MYSNKTPIPSSYSNYIQTHKYLDFITSRNKLKHNSVGPHSRTHTNSWQNEITPFQAWYGDFWVRGNPALLPVIQEQ